MVIRERLPENERLCLFSGDSSRWALKGGGGGDQREVEGGDGKQNPENKRLCSFSGLGGDGSQ